MFFLYVTVHNRSNICDNAKHTLDFLVEIHIRSWSFEIKFLLLISMWKEWDPIWVFCSCVVKNLRSKNMHILHEGSSLCFFAHCCLNRLHFLTLYLIWVKYWGELKLGAMHILMVSKEAQWSSYCYIGLRYEESLWHFLLLECYLMHRLLSIFSYRMEYSYKSFIFAIALIVYRSSASLWCIFAKDYFNKPSSDTIF